MIELPWVEKYRPTSLDDYVFQNENNKSTILKWISEGYIPQLLLSGPPGTGKTTLSKILIKELNIHSYDILSVNGSKEGRKIDWLRDTLENFCLTMPFGEYKVVLIDEADGLGPVVQPALRNLTEEYSSHVRFIMTCNYANKIIHPLRSRFQEIKIDKLDKTDFSVKVAEILLSESVKFDIETLDYYIDLFYPDMRKTINTIELNVVDNSLINPSDDVNLTDYRVKMVELFKNGNILEARKLLCDNAAPDEMEDIYRWIYTHLEYFGKSQEQKDQAVLIVKQAMVDHVICADAEINLAACMIRLSRNMEE